MLFLMFNVTIEFKHNSYKDNNLRSGRFIIFPYLFIYFFIFRCFVWAHVCVRGGVVRLLVPYYTSRKVKSYGSFAWHNSSFISAWSCPCVSRGFLSPQHPFGLTKQRSLMKKIYCLYFNVLIQVLSYNLK